MTLEARSNVISLFVILMDFSLKKTNNLNYDINTPIIKEIR